MGVGGGTQLNPLLPCRFPLGWVLGRVSTQGPFLFAQPRPKAGETDLRVLPPELFDIHPESRAVQPPVHLVHALSQEGPNENVGHPYAADCPSGGSTDCLGDFTIGEFVAGDLHDFFHEFLGVTEGCRREGANVFRRNQLHLPVPGKGIFQSTLGDSVPDLRRKVVLHEEDRPKYGPLQPDPAEVFLYHELCLKVVEVAPGVCGCDGGVDEMPDPGLEGRIGHVDPLPDLFKSTGLQIVLNAKHAMNALHGGT